MTTATLAACLLLLSPAARAAQADAATLVAVDGPVEIVGPAGAVAAKAPLELAPGATIRTADGGSAVVVLENGTKMRVGPRTEFTFREGGEQSTVVAVLKGLADFWVRPMGRRRLLVRTPGAVASVRGTKLQAGSDGVRSFYTLFEGEIAVTDAFGRSTILTPGQRASISVARGLSGTSSLPPGARAPGEPDVPAPAKRPAPPPPAAERETDGQTPGSEPPATVPSDGAPGPVAPPSPGQQRTVTPVSPSAP